MRRFLPLAIFACLAASSIFQQMTIHAQRTLLEHQDAVLKQVDAALKDAGRALESRALGAQQALEGRPRLVDAPRYSISHAPKDGNCPAGTEKRDGYFFERDGSQQAACYDAKGDGSIDELRPGEGMGMTIRIGPPRQDKPEPAGRGKS